jgi:hypothetical protein
LRIAPDWQGRKHIKLTFVGLFLAMQLLVRLQGVLLPPLMQLARVLVMLLLRLGMSIGDRN